MLFLVLLTFLPWRSGNSCNSRFSETGGWQRTLAIFGFLATYVRAGVVASGEELRSVHREVANIKRLIKRGGGKPWMETARSGTVAVTKSSRSWQETTSRTAVSSGA